METQKTDKPKTAIPPELQAELDSLKDGHIAFHNTIIRAVHAYLSEPPHNRAKIMSALDCLAAGVSLIVAGTQPEGHSETFNFFTGVLRDRLRDDLAVAKEIHAAMDRMEQQGVDA